MGIATNTVAGDVILRGDLTGTAASPQLAPTGVEAGYYVGAQIVVDAKGRLLYADTGSTVNFEDLVAIATTTTHGLVIPAGVNIDFDGGAEPIISVATATTTNKGVVQIQPSAGFSITSGVLDTVDATTSSKGVVQVNNSGYLDVSAGVLTLTWPLAFPDATAISRGAVQIGDNISVSAGLISVPTGTTSVKGVLQVGTNIDVAGGIISVETATDAVKGVVQIGDNISVSSGVISIPDTTTGVLGVARVGSNISVVDGLISVATGTTSVKGIVQVGTNIDVSGAVISVADATTSVKGVVQGGLGVNAVAGLITPNAAGVTASIPDATTSSLGIIRLSTGINLGLFDVDISGVLTPQLADTTANRWGIIKAADNAETPIVSGEISIGTPIAKLDVEQTFTKAQRDSVLASELFAATYNNWQLDDPHTNIFKTVPEWPGGNWRAVPIAPPSSEIGDELIWIINNSSNELVKFPTAAAGLIVPDAYEDGSSLTLLPNVADANGVEYTTMIIHGVSTSTDQYHCSIMLGF